VCGNLKVFKYNDHNGNGNWETGEEGVGGIMFTINGPQSFTLITNQYGEAFKYCIPLGTYTITENVPNGWTATTQNPQTVYINSELLKETMFGNKQTPTTTTSTTTSTTTTTTSTTTTSTTCPTTTTSTTATSTTTTIPCMNGLKIRARGESAAGVLPVMQLWIDGKLKAQWNVLDSVRDYLYETNLGTAGHNIDVVYANDCSVVNGTIDRNLYVYQIQADCTIIQSTDCSVKYDKGVGSKAFDGLDVAQGQVEMYWSGALKFKTNGGYIGTTSTTSATTTTTTSLPSTTTTTNSQQCALAGDYPKCGEITIGEVIDLINKWVQDQASMEQVLALLNAYKANP
jgi:hypothetical protein